MNLSTSYWNSQGRYKAVADKMDKLIPASGECPEAKGANKALDRYRRARNCYYDLFNNGLCNRGAEFRALFKVGKLPRRTYGRGCNLDFDAIIAEGKVDAVLDKLILAAAKEQGIEVKEVSDADKIAALRAALSNLLDDISDMPDDDRERFGGKDDASVKGANAALAL
jgi:hypothetical protein